MALVFGWRSACVSLDFEFPCVQVFNFYAKTFQFRRGVIDTTRNTTKAFTPEWHFCLPINRSPFHSLLFRRPFLCAFCIRKSLMRLNIPPVIEFWINLCRIFLNANDPDGTAFTYLLVSLWSSYILAEQVCIFLLLFVKSKMNVAIIVTYIFCVCLALASGTVRSFKGLQPWLQENTKATHTRYASTLLHSAVFLSRHMNCTPGGAITCPLTTEYLFERLGRATPQENIDMAASIGFAVGFIAFNMLVYLLPMPNFIRRKYKD